MKMSEAKKLNPEKTVEFCKGFRSGIHDWKNFGRNLKAPSVSVPAENQEEEDWDSGYKAGLAYAQEWRLTSFNNPCH